MVSAFSTSILGSPFLDVTLGQVDAVRRVIQDLVLNSANKKGVDIMEEDEDFDEDTQQFDSILPPELPSEWVQCDLPNCRKWRRVAWNGQLFSSQCSVHFLIPRLF